MIIDKVTGKQYIGSAYGDDGIYGRWMSYALSQDGGNKEFVKIKEEIDKGPEYFNNFKYIILEVIPKTASQKEVTDRETYYKKRFLTKEFGYNDN